MKYEYLIISLTKSFILVLYYVTILQILLTLQQKYLKDN